MPTDPAPGSGRPRSVGGDAIGMQQLQVLTLRCMTQGFENQTEFFTQLNGMLADFMHRTILVTPEEFEPVVGEMRETWSRVLRSSREERTALAVLHGLAERGIWLDLSRLAMAFFQRNLRSLGRQRITGERIENEAARMGLPVCDPEETVEAVSANFGYVDTIEEHRARVVLLDEHDENAIADLWAPINWLPRAYREVGAGIAWVERKYRSGTKGRFEPASAGG